MDWLVIPYVNGTDSPIICNKWTCPILQKHIHQGLVFAANGMVKDGALLPKEVRETVVDTRPMLKEGLCSVEDGQVAIVFKGTDDGCVTILVAGVC